MHRNPRSIISRYNKCRALASRGATRGERAAGEAASYRMWCRYDVLREANPFKGILGFRWEILEVLYGMWDNKANGYAEGTDTLELRWWLAGFDHKELRGALKMLRERRSAGYVAGVYCGPKINFIENDLKMLNCLEWPLQMALAASEIAEFGETLSA